MTFLFFSSITLSYCQTDCNKMIELLWIGVGEEFYQYVEKYIGAYQKSERKHNGHHVYEKVERGIVTSYLFFRPECGWRINEVLLSDPLDLPDIIIKKCLDRCPENCLNHGQWMYRKNKKWHFADKNQRMAIKGYDTNTDTNSLLIVAIIGFVVSPVLSLIVVLLVLKRCYSSPNTATHMGHHEQQYALKEDIIQLQNLITQSSCEKKKIKCSKNSFFEAKPNGSPISYNGGRYERARNDENNPHDVPYNFKRNNSSIIFDIRPQSSSQERSYSVCEDTSSFESDILNSNIDTVHGNHIESNSENDISVHHTNEVSSSKAAVSSMYTSNFKEKCKHRFVQNQKRTSSFKNLHGNVYNVNDCGMNKSNSIIYKAENDSSFTQVVRNKENTNTRRSRERLLSLPTPFEQEQSEARKVIKLYF